MRVRREVGVDGRVQQRDEYFSPFYLAAPCDGGVMWVVGPCSPTARSLSIVISMTCSSAVPGRRGELTTTRPLVWLGIACDARIRYVFSRHHPAMCLA
jgi:hypothetical protein